MTLTLVIIDWLILHLSTAVIHRGQLWWTGTAGPYWDIPVPFLLYILYDLNYNEEGGTYIPRPDGIAWTPTCNTAFTTLKKALCSSPILGSPNFARSFTLQTDASDRGIGAVLSQVNEAGEEHPVAFYSWKLLPHEERYSTVEKECLAIKAACWSFRVYLLGRPFKVQTDHRALEWLDRIKDNNTRLTRWSLALQPFAYTVEYRVGKANANADTLSRAHSEPATG